MRIVLGIDSSTQSTKVEARDLDSGLLIATGSARHPPTAPPKSEQNPSAWWEALKTAVGEIGEHRTDVVAIAVAGQQHGLVLLDHEGRELRPAKLWNDTTSARDAADLVAEYGPQMWAERCGSVPVASFTISKLAWVARNEPEILPRVAMVMLPHDYLTWRLSGRHVTDRGDASGTGWFNPAANRYEPDLLRSFVTEPESWLSKFPTLLGPDEAAGIITAAASTELGLAPDVLVGPGTGDNMAAALGLGLGIGDVALSLGTSGTVCAVSATPTSDPTGLVAGFADAAGGFLPLVCTLNATKVTDTVARWLGTDAAGLSDLAAAASPSDRVVLVPYFDGERTPNLPDATGSFHGLTNTTTREALARAAHDGVLCGLLDGLDALHQASVETGGRIHLIGGGARSATYRQRCADLTGRQIFVPDVDEAVATGAALQAAAIGSDTSAATIAQRWNLGAGSAIDPHVDGTNVRAAYHEAKACSA